VDVNAGVISEKEAAYERELLLRESIGSTLSGTGAGVAARVLRRGDFKLAKDVPELRPFLTSVAEEVNAAVHSGQEVIVEGTQGFGLSLYHSDSYPYATSRDTTASAFLSEVGLSPLTVKSVIMVIRTYPIRVGGNSGPLKGEITWQELQRRSRYPHEIMEFTTATGRPRRIAGFDLDLVKRAAIINRPTCIALHGADYLDYKNKGVTRFEALSDAARHFVVWIERELGVKVGFVGTGPTNEEMIDRLFQRDPSSRDASVLQVGGTSAW
jgi:adenylosuccinate synthase